MFLLGCVKSHFIRKFVNLLFLFLNFKFLDIHRVEFILGFDVLLFIFLSLFFLDLKLLLRVLSNFHNGLTHIIIFLRVLKILDLLLIVLYFLLIFCLDLCHHLHDLHIVLLLWLLL